MSRKIKFTMNVEVSAIIEDAAYPAGADDDQVIALELESMSQDPGMFLDMALTEDGDQNPVGSVEYGVEIMEARNVKTNP